MVFNAKENLPTSDNISLKVRKNMVKALRVWSVVLYGSEPWTTERASVFILILQNSLLKRIIAGNI